jgi:hypothetical protein
MIMNVEKLVEDVSQCHIVLHRSQITLRGMEHGPSQWEPDDQLPELGYDLKCCHKLNYS